MIKEEKNDVFLQKRNSKDRLIVFHDKLKRHLSNEFIYLTDKKNEIENEIFRLKIEKEKKDKILFQSVEKKDVRKYFSPLNISAMEEDQKDEKQKQLSMNMERLNNEVWQIDRRIEEIKEFLKDIDELLLKNLSSQTKKREKEEKREKDLKKGNQKATENITKEKSVPRDIFLEDIKVYPQMLRSLQELAECYQNRYSDFDIMLEFNDNNIEIDLEVNKNILDQVIYNIEIARKKYELSMILIQGEANEDVIDLTLSYICTDDNIDTVKVSYVVQRM